MDWGKLAALERIVLQISKIFLSLIIVCWKHASELPNSLRFCSKCVVDDLCFDYLSAYRDEEFCTVVKVSGCQVILWSFQFCYASPSCRPHWFQLSFVIWSEFQVQLSCCSIHGSLLAEQGQGCTPTTQRWTSQTRLQVWDLNLCEAVSKFKWSVDLQRFRQAVPSAQSSQYWRCIQHGRWLESWIRSDNESKEFWCNATSSLEFSIGFNICMTWVKSCCRRTTQYSFVVSSHQSHVSFSHLKFCIGNNLKLISKTVFKPVVAAWAALVDSLSLRNA